MNIHASSFLGELLVEFSTSSALEEAGLVWMDEEKIGVISCAAGPTLLCSIHTLDRRYRISVQKFSAAEATDVIVEESALGELVRIERDREETWREEIESRLGFGLCDRGFFLSPAATAAANRPVAACLVAALCLYFPSLENSFNTSYPSG